MRGPCAKRQVRCVIYPIGSPAIIGENDCESPQPTCPRADGEGYEKCRTVCHQAGHAELMALQNAAGVDIEGSRAVLVGHYWMCEPCGRALREAGIRSVTIEFESSTTSTSQVGANETSTPEFPDN